MVKINADKCLMLKCVYGINFCINTPQWYMIIIIFWYYCVTGFEYWMQALRGTLVTVQICTYLADSRGIPPFLPIAFHFEHAMWFVTKGGVSLFNYPFYKKGQCIGVLGLAMLATVWGLRLIGNQQQACIWNIYKLIRIVIFQF